MQGWVYMCSVVLVAAGFAKVRDPAPTIGALVAASVRVPRSAVLGLGTLEIAAGLAVLVAGGVLAGAATAALYGSFALFVGVALQRNLPVQSCGCFGRGDTPPSALHVVVNLAAAAGTVAFTATGAPSLVDTLRDQPLAGLPYAGFVGIGAFALYLMFTELPRIMRLAAEVR